MGLKVAAGSVAATLPGVLDSHLAVSFGYGLAMLWIGGLFLPGMRKGKGEDADEDTTQFLLKVA